MLCIEKRFRGWGNRRSWVEPRSNSGGIELLFRPFGATCSGRGTPTAYAVGAAFFRRFAAGPKLLLFFGALVRLLQILTGFFQGAEGVVVGLDGLAVFVDGALAPPSDIINLAELDAAPDFGPAGLPVSIDGFAVGIGRRLIVSLQEKDFGDAVVGQGAVLVDVERLVEFGQGAGKIALLLQGLSAEDRGAQLHVARIGEHSVVGIDRDAAWAPKGFDRERRVGADDFDAL